MAPEQMTNVAMRHGFILTVFPLPLSLIYFTLFELPGVPAQAGTPEVWEPIGRHFIVVCRHFRLCRLTTVGLL